MPLLLYRLVNDEMRNSIAEVVRFCTVGLTATAVHFLILTLTVEQLAIPPSPANGLAFICALLVTYLGQSLWVFSERSRHSAAQILRFSVSLGVGMITNVGVMALSVHGLNLSYQTGFTIGLILVPVLSFPINRFWVFKNV